MLISRDPSDSPNIDPNYLSEEEDVKMFIRRFLRGVLAINKPKFHVSNGSLEDPYTLVDPQLWVKGIERLRVVNASIMPDVTPGNTNATTIIIAEKAADIILERKPKFIDSNLLLFVLFVSNLVSLKRFLMKYN
ncbi:hypothetical protein CHS0354_021820 [Potamilus streckersoni]|uniref:Glucose-methanol-choline oxidoreductase C-terminal domain-containing protein n=1 Tax=Potamilus streckersoni TaxID=2493646 RepID=A0AAE0VNP4_9BIVA|nr:hypothetical protein CHS0354_021820 [Potamilus streckersoni]